MNIFWNNTGVASFSRGTLVPSSTKTLDDNLAMQADTDIVVSKQKVKIWGGAKTDLQRMGTFELNGKVVYDENHLVPGSSDDERQEYVFQKIFDETGSLTGAQAVAALTHQMVVLEALTEMMNRKVLNADEVVPAAITQATGVEYDAQGQTFKVVKELLVKTIDGVKPEDTSKYRFFKVKVIVSGNTTELMSRKPNTSTFQYTYQHTGTFMTENSAKKAQYTYFGATEKPLIV